MYTCVFLAAAVMTGDDLLLSDPPKAPMDAVPVAKPKNGMEAQRDARDRVVRSIGKEALPFTRQFGSLAVSCLERCEPATGKKLVALFSSGELGRLKNPRAVLNAVQQNGEPAAAWLCEHHEQLIDPEAVEAWCQSPLSFAFDLRDIEQAAQELRESRRRVPQWVSTAAAEWNASYIVIGVLVLILLAVIVWKRNPSPEA